MKKIIILLISLTLIVSCLVIGASAKLFTPPYEATDCLVFVSQSIAYPYYSFDEIQSIGSNIIYPTFLDVYDTDTISFRVANGSYYEILVNRSDGNLTISAFHTGEAERITIYDDVGYDVLFYYYNDKYNLDEPSSRYFVVDENYNVIASNVDDKFNFNSYKVTVADAESNGKTIGYGVAVEPPETEPPETEAPETETPVVPPVTPSDPSEGGHITEVITDGIIPFVGGLGSAFVMAFTSLFIYEGNINVLGIFILTMFGIALGYGVIRWITHLFRKE